jgi:hypothetical protein
MGVYTAYGCAGPTWLEILRPELRLAYCAARSWQVTPHQCAIFRRFIRRAEAFSDLNRAARHLAS